MPLDRRQAFKFGFLLKCAEAGLTPEQTTDFIEHCLKKTAEGGMSSWLGLPLGAAALGAAGSVAVGGAGGYAAAKLTEPQVDIEEAKQRELITALRLYADNARRSAARRSYRPAQAPSAPRLMR